MVATDPHPQLHPPIVLVAIGGDPYAPPPVLPVVPGGSVVVAADAGLHLLDELGIVAHHLVGDLDSAAPAAVAAAEARGVRVQRHHADKDASDLELALIVATEVAAAEGIEAVVVVGRGGGRLDLVLMDVALLAAPWLAQLRVEARFGDAVVHVVHGPRRLTVGGHRGEIMSLMAIGGVARDVSAHGVRWPLVDADLSPGSTRGISNEVTGEDAVVEVGDGTVLVVLPGVPAPVVAPRPDPYDPSPSTEPGAIP